MFRKKTVNRVINSLRSHFQQIEQNKRPSQAKQLIISKLAQDIQQIYQLLYGTIESEAKASYIKQLIPCLVDENDNFFYKLAKYRTQFSFEVQTNIGKILAFIVENGNKYGIGISHYIQQQTNSKNGHNKIIDSLFKEFHTNSGGVFMILQEMTKRTDLTSMLLNKINIKTPKKQSISKITSKSSKKATTTNHCKSSSYSFYDSKLNKNDKVTKSRTMSFNKAPPSMPMAKKEEHQSKRGHSKTMDFSSLQPIPQNKQFGHHKHYKNHTSPESIKALLDEIHKEDEKENNTPFQPKPSLKTSATKSNGSDITFVEGLFDLVKWPSLAISLDAFKTLHSLFTTTPNDKFSDYFYKNYQWLFLRFNELINSDNALHKRQFFNLLNLLLTKSNNFDVLMKYITEKDNISIAKRILTDQFIISHTDDKNHNLIIDTLLEEYFEDAGDILTEIASRPSLSDLLLNHTFITRLHEDEEVIDFDDLKQQSITPSILNGSNSSLSQSLNATKETKSSANHKNISEYLGIPPPSESGIVPPLRKVDTAESSASKSVTVPSKTRYSGEDEPCFRRSPHNEVQRNHDDENDHDLTERYFVMELISLINRSCNNSVAVYSFNVLQLLLTVNKEKAATFLLQHYDEMIVKFRQLIRIENQNKLRQKQFLGLLTEILLESKNSKFRRKFKSQVINLRIIMNLLKSKSETIAYDAFHIFAMFATSKLKTREIHVILWRNTKENKLAGFIENLLPNKSKTYQDLDEEKRIVIQHLNNLPTPKSDESYLNLPRVQ